MFGPEPPVASLSATPRSSHSSMTPRGTDPPSAADHAGLGAKLASASEGSMVYGRGGPVLVNAKVERREEEIA